MKTNPAFEQIPVELRSQPQWVAWRGVRQLSGKLDKRPIAPATGSLASVSDPASWGTFDAAVARQVKDKLAGIGFVFTKDDGLSGIDFDDCIDATGAIAVDAWQDIETLDSYAEISPSGRGVKVFISGKLPGPAVKTPHVELYDHGRFFTVTGQHVSGTPATINDRTEALRGLYARLRPSSINGTEIMQQTLSTHRAAPSGIEIVDDELVRIAFAARNGSKVQALWQGDTTAHGSDESRADLALCNHLAFYATSPEQIDRLFRRSGLYRAKWDEKHFADGRTYGQATIQKALAERTEFYEPAMDAGRARQAESAEARTLGDVIATFRHYLYMPDSAALEIDLAAVVANRAPGDPVWVLDVAPPGGGKTERICSLTDSPDVRIVGTLTEGALLSGTSKKERLSSATGGLLRELGEFGIIAIKDFGTILAMNRESRSTILQALRDVYDGQYTRNVGTDGGRTLEWKGKIGLIAGTTGSIDRAHAVISLLGERFVMVRTLPDERAALARAALAHAGKEVEMRQELRRAVTGLLTRVIIPSEPALLTEKEKTSLVALADLATMCRAPVARDSYRFEVEDVPGAECPTRIMVIFRLLFNGFLAIGCNRARAWQLLRRIALDSMPLPRRNILSTLFDGITHTTRAIAIATGYPTVTVRRAAEDLACYGLLQRRTRDETGEMADTWTLAEWTKGACLAAGVSDILGHIHTTPIHYSDSSSLKYTNTPQARISETISGEPGDLDCEEAYQVYKQKRKE